MLAPFPAMFMPAARRSASRVWPCARRSLHQKVPPGPAFAFDIDGVLKQGEKVLPEAKEALQLLVKRRTPFILITNGGGTLEYERAKKLTHELGVNIAEHQIVQSHTIFRSLASKFADKPVFVVGGTHDNCRRVAEHYGFTQPYIPADVIAWNPAVWPFHRLSEKEKGYVKQADFSKISFAAVLVFHDSRDWGRDIQLVLDLVRAERGVFGTHKDVHDKQAWAPENQIPVYFSNPDLLWGNDFSQPRFGQGALQESMAAVYKMTTGYDLQRHTGGKPTKATYDYSSGLLHAAIDADAKGLKEIDRSGNAKSDFSGRVYMIGDNPRSDIAGANGYGWESVLVRTGVFRGKEEDAEHKPSIVLPHVLDAVRWALKREGQL